jgi:antitoxin VapB
MSLLIEGSRIDALVDRYCSLTGESGKAEAVCQALLAQIAILSAQAERSRDIQQCAAAGEFVSTGPNDKRFMDREWGED